MYLKLPRRFMLFSLWLLALCLPAWATAAVPVLTTPATENVGAGMATLLLQSDSAGMGYFTVLPGSFANCGSGEQVKAGQDSSDAKAPYAGSLSLTAATNGKYFLRNLTQSTPYTICFTAESPAGANLNPNPLSANLTTTAITSIANPQWTAVGSAVTPAAIYAVALTSAPDGSPVFGYKDQGTFPYISTYASGTWTSSPRAYDVLYGTNSLALSVAPNGMPYIAHNGFNGIGKLKRYNGSSWAQVGTDFSSAANIIALAFGPDGSAYVAYQDGSSGNKATVKRYDGTAWAVVGSAGFSSGQIGSISLAFAPDGTPYVAYKDSSTTPTNRATVSKFDGSTWVAVGQTGFSTNPATELVLAVDQDGTPYVAYADAATTPANRATVMKYDGAAWVNVGNPGFSAGSSALLSLAIAPDGKPYVFYQDGGNGNKATVMRFDGAAWVNVANPGFSSFAIYFGTGLTFGLDGLPLIGFKDDSLDYKGTVMTLSPQQNMTDVTIASSDARFGYVVDGTQFIGQHTFSWPQGSSHNVGIINSLYTLPGEIGTRHIFDSWSDGNYNPSRVYVTPNTAATVTAQYDNQYLLSVNSNPANAGYVSILYIWQYIPLPAQIWRVAGTVLDLASISYDGYKFAGWSGAGSDNPKTITMNGPINLTANFSKAYPWLSAEISNKSGLKQSREWLITLENSGESGAINVSASIQVNAVPKTGCAFSKSVQLAYDPIGAGNSSGKVIPFNFSDCPNTAKFNVKIDFNYSDNNGNSYTGTKTYYNMLR